ncbi:MAG TPA: PilZ domain-containing protein [bacterium]|nr:PilZ domain-containing protein [bacterium]
MRENTVSQGAEKRRIPRMPTDWQVQARVLGDEDAIQDLRILNVSSGGLAMRVDRPLERDAVLKISFAPGDGGDDVQAYATVAWTLGPDELQAGLRFIGIGENDQERLAGMVERWVSAAGRGGSRH